MNVPDRRWRSALALLALLGLAACGGEAPPPASRPAAAPVPVAAMEVQPREVSRELVLSGTVEARVNVRVAARTAGLVERVWVEEGRQVVAGELLAELDMAEARAELVRAQAEQRAAMLAWRRAAELHERGVVSAAQLDAARVALEVADSEQALRQTRADFGSIVAPIDAVVAARHVEPGEAVQAHAALFELASLDDLVVRVRVSELDVVHLEPSQSVTLGVDALPALALSATVRRIFPVADAASRQTTVEIALPSDASALGVRPGFLARVQARIDIRPDALVVPVAAVGVDGRGHYVYVIDQARLARRAVTPGVTRGQWVEVTEGLTTGEQVLASNPIEMREGQAVRVVTLRHAADAR